MSAPLYAFCRWGCAVLLRAGWRLRVIDAAKVPLEGPLIVACNHVSYFDPPALGVAMPRPVRYMAKSELFSIPVLGLLIAGLGAYPVDRKRGDTGAIKRALELLRKGAAVGVFPEGTRNLDGTIKGQMGVALLASLSGAAVLPAYVGGSAGARRLQRISVVFGDPLHFERGRKARREDLAKWTEEIMRRIYALREKLGDH